MRRRKTFSATAVSYAAVGSTQAADVAVFPPPGFRSTSDEFRLGSGRERFEAASAALMTWGVPLGSQLGFTHVSQAEDAGYPGILFTEFGAPIAPRENALERLFAPDGTAYLAAGDSVAVEGVFSPSAIAAAYRVIYVIHEERRIGYAWGTLGSSPVVGEEYFGLEWRSDDAVVFVLVTVTQIASQPLMQLMTPIIHFRQWMMRRQYVRSLLPARSI